MTKKAIGVKKNKGKGAENIFLRLCGLLTTHPDYKPMDLYLNSLKAGQILH